MGCLGIYKENISCTMLVALLRCRKLKLFYLQHLCRLLCLPAKGIKFNFVIQASYQIENAHILSYKLLGSSIIQLTGLSIFWIIGTLLFIIESPFKFMFSNVVFLR